MTKYIFTLFLLVSSMCYGDPRVRPQSWAQPVIGTDLDNLYKIDKNIYRSEQPDEEDAKDLKSLGIKEILNLREYHSDKDEIGGKDFLFHHIKLDTGDIKEKQIIEALRIIKNKKAPILVHCWHGSDRTGVIIASYRIVFNNWSKARALDEMANGNYGYHAKVYPELISLVENLNVTKIKKALEITE